MTLNMHDNWFMAHGKETGNHVKPQHAACSDAVYLSAISIAGDDNCTQWPCDRKEKRSETSTDLPAEQKRAWTRRLYKDHC